MSAVNPVNTAELHKNFMESSGGFNVKRYYVYSEFCERLSLAERSMSIAFEMMYGNNMESVLSDLQKASAENGAESRLLAEKGGQAIVLQEGELICVISALENIRYYLTESPFKEKKWQFSNSTQTKSKFLFEINHIYETFIKVKLLKVPPTQLVMSIKCFNAIPAKQKRPKEIDCLILHFLIQLYFKNPYFTSGARSCDEISWETIPKVYENDSSFVVSSSGVTRIWLKCREMKRKLTEK